MLRLENIHKVYTVGDGKVEALKGVNLSFRKNEFVAILGPSGCGKTTLLNIIGGLDQYTDGELFILGRSTKLFNAHDWDVYRNHRIGFIFQSYNLIPHQTILENVELSLTIAGLDKKTRIEKAKSALDKVGLKDQYDKHPNQLSGGQCQRVAIARALVNEPEILLADEPTGALDTVTSVQIMDLIKEISKEKLVIMVTHNPELADKYSSRIVRLLDGKVISDTNPYTQEEEIEETSELNVLDGEKEKAKMSFATAFKLSARNLKSKAKRTAMVCVAGSIGIIGVASVLAVSSGVTGYINNMQEDMLSGNPVSIFESTIDFASMMQMTPDDVKQDAIEEATKDGYVDVNYLIEYLASRGGKDGMMINNTITQDYIDYVQAMPKEYYNAMGVYYGIDLSNNIYTDIELEGYGKIRMSLTAIRNIYTSLLEKTEFAAYSSMIGSVTTSFKQAPDSQDYILSQYDIISDESTSRYASNSDEVMLVVNKNTRLTDIFLGQLGYYSQDEFLNIIDKATDGENYDSSLDKDSFSYEELLGKKFTLYPNDTVYTPSIIPSPVNPFSYNAYEDENWTSGKELKITAILRPKEGVSYGCLQSGIYYTKALTDEFLVKEKDSQVVKYLNDIDHEQFQSGLNNKIPYGITYKYNFQLNKEKFENVDGFVGKMMTYPTGNGTPIRTYLLSLRELGGCDIPNQFDIYPLDFDQKYLVTDYLDAWNGDGDIMVNDKLLTKEDRVAVTYSDNLEVIINMINDMINIVTIALIAFTALSLVVSTVMIGIITYVSVIERIKEIGVIRSLGGRKKDVSHLFNAETFIVGSISGLIGIGVTYLLSGGLNLLVGSLSGIYTIAVLPWWQAIIMVLISVLLTLISGLIPAKIAAKKDPVDALRTE